MVLVAARILPRCTVLPPPQRGDVPPLNAAKPGRRPVDDPPSTQDAPERRRPTAFGRAKAGDLFGSPARPGA